ncbi:hypothetical protein GCM10027360_09080 [Amycolatopsis echigonensis]
MPTGPRGTTGLATPSTAFVIGAIIPCRKSTRREKGQKPGFTPTGGGLALAPHGTAGCRPMMPKRAVAAVLIAALVLAGGGVLTSLFL